VANDARATAARNQRSFFSRIALIKAKSDQVQKARKGTSVMNVNDRIKYGG
jgi:hypothetical protein